MRLKKTIASLAIVIPVIISYMIYLQETFQVDEELIQSMPVAGIHLLDSEKEVIKKLGTGKPKAGCFGCGLYAYYPEQNITISTFVENHKVVHIVIHDTSHSILGIRVGDSVQSAIPKLQKHGLVPIAELGNFTYHKDDLVIYFNLDDRHKISEINLTVRETSDLLPIPQHPIY
jgi:hypothetical protein